MRKRSPSIPAPRAKASSRPARACPHCGAQKSAASKWAKRAAVAVAGAGFGVTLMACYGPPPREYEKTPATPASTLGDASSPTTDASK